MLKLKNQVESHILQNRHFRRFAAASLFLVVASVIVLQLKPEPDLPKVDGKSIEEWFSQIEQGEPRDRAIQKIMSTGIDSVDFLRDKMAYTGEFERIYFEFVSRIPEVCARVLPRPSWDSTREQVIREQRILAACILSFMKSQAVDARPEARRAAKDTDPAIRSFGLSALAWIGPEKRDLSLLTQSLNDKSNGVVHNALEGLAQMGQDAAKAIPMVRYIKHHHEKKSIQAMATYTLEKIQKPSVGIHTVDPGEPED